MNRETCWDDHHCQWFIQYCSYLIEWVLQEQEALINKGSLNDSALCLNQQHGLIQREKRQWISLSNIREEYFDWQSQNNPWRHKMLKHWRV